MTRTGWLVRMAACVGIDVLDFTVGRGLVAIPWEEGAGSLVLMLMWGPAGLLYLAEIADLTEQFDAFVPTATVIGLIAGWRHWRANRRSLPNP
jgi:hypothetical protein